MSAACAHAGHLLPRLCVCTIAVAAACRPEPDTSSAPTHAPSTVAPLGPIWQLREPGDDLSLSVLGDADVTTELAPGSAEAVALSDGSLLVAAEVSEREFEATWLFVELRDVHGWRPTRANLLFLTDYKVPCWTAYLAGSVAARTDGKLIACSASLNEGAPEAFSHTFLVEVGGSARHLKRILQVFRDTEERRSLLSSLAR